MSHGDDYPSLSLKLSPTTMLPFAVCIILCDTMLYPSNKNKKDAGLSQLLPTCPLQQIFLFAAAANCRKAKKETNKFGVAAWAVRKHGIK